MKASYLYDAVWLGARAAGNVVKAGLNPLNQTHLLSALYNTTFTGLTGRVSVDTNGDRVNGQFGLYNLQPNEDGTMRSVLVGVFKNNELQFVSPFIFPDGATIAPKDPEEILFVPFNTGPVALVVLASLGLAGMIAAIITVAFLRHNKLIRRSSLFFLIVILCGLALTLVSIFFWLGTPTPMHCHLRV